MPFAQRMKFVAFALIVMFLVTMLAVARNPTPYTPKHKTDREMIREAGEQLHAACELDEGKC